MPGRLASTIENRLPLKFVLSKAADTTTYILHMLLAECGSSRAATYPSGWTRTAPSSESFVNCVQLCPSLANLMSLRS
jgi:hypothetical protein